MKGWLGNRATSAWLLVVACIAVIWTFSGEGFSAPATSHFVEPVLRWLYPEIDANGLFLAHFYVRKCAHLTEYGLLALLAFRALRFSLNVRLRWICVLALGLVLSVASADELRQSILPSRAGSVLDVGLNLIGGTVGVILIVLIHRIFGVGPPVRARPAPPENRP